MRSPEFCEVLRPMVLAQRVSWVAFTLSLGVYMLVAYLVVHGETTDSASVEPIFDKFLYVLSIGSAAGSYLFRRQALAPERLRRLLVEDVSPHTLAIGPQWGMDDAERLRRLKALPPDEQRLVRLVQHLQTVMIISLVLHEVIGIFGLVLAFLRNEVTLALLFMLVAAGLNCLVFPQPKKIVSQVQTGKYWQTRGHS